MRNSPLWPTTEERRWLLILIAAVVLGYLGTNLIDTPYTFNWGFP